jgi:hypothetical protein
MTIWWSYYRKLMRGANLVNALFLLARADYAPPSFLKRAHAPRQNHSTAEKMNFTQIDEIELPAAFDAHVHLRDGEMSQLVTPTIRRGGVNQVYVMVRTTLSFLVAFKLQDLQKRILAVLSYIRT